jgi:predicted O-linked N-acetylglucosamine transferase (SPINDLY family)
VATALETAKQHHRGGRLADAERLYREELATNPAAAEAAFLLGVLAMGAGRTDEAVDMFLRATTQKPDNPAYHANLGEAYRRSNQFRPAIDAFYRAITLKPDMVAPIYNLGLLLQECGAIDAAVECFARAADLAANVPDVQQRLASAKDEQRRLTREPPSREANAASAAVLCECARSLSSFGLHEQAHRLVDQALRADPTSAEAHCHLGNVLLALRRSDEAIAAYRRAVQLDPALHEAHGNLANALGGCGLMKEAIASYRTSIALKPTTAHHSNLVFSMHFDPECDARAILAEARAWDRAHAAGLAEGPPVDIDRSPEKRLRIGYVSPDFRGHCQALFTLPLLAHHDHESFEIVAYSNVLAPDDFTARLMGFTDRWCSIVGMDDAAVAARIRADRIDILVDLTMHMEQNRLGVFARKPAPVQVCWLAYPGTTGLSAMDFRISDPFLDPPGGDEDVYSERTVRLPDTFWCYNPLRSEPEVNPLPAREHGYIVFGCLNNFVKVHRGVIELWARVLRDVPRSRLLLLVPPGETRRRTIEIFEANGVARERLDLVGFKLRPEYLATYRSIDVCLDTFPYNGHTTSLDAFLMGVPVVTLAGSTVAGRAGLSQATNLGLPELVATTPDDFVRAAVALCGDLDRLTELRAGLRRRMESSPLMDAPRFARNLEAAYREMWRDSTRR